MGASACAAGPPSRAPFPRAARPPSPARAGRRRPAEDPSLPPWTWPGPYPRGGLRPGQTAELLLRCRRMGPSLLPCLRGLRRAVQLTLALSQQFNRRLMLLTACKDDRQGKTKTRHDETRRGRGINQNQRRGPKHTEKQRAPRGSFPPNPNSTCCNESTGNFGDGAGPAQCRCTKSKVEFEKTWTALTPGCEKSWIHYDRPMSFPVTKSPGALSNESI